MKCVHYGPSAESSRNALRRRNVKTACQRFMDEQEPVRKSESGKVLVRAIFGNAAIAEDPVR
jgi:hypothetical protein